MLKHGGSGPQETTAEAASPVTDQNDITFTFVQVVIVQPTFKGKVRRRVKGCIVLLNLPLEAFCPLLQGTLGQLLPRMGSWESTCRLLVQCSQSPHVAPPPPTGRGRR